MVKVDNFTSCFFGVTIHQPKVVIMYHLRRGVTCNPNCFIGVTLYWCLDTGQQQEIPETKNETKMINTKK